MTPEEFDSLVELIRALALEAVLEHRPAHNRACRTDGESAIAMARIYLVSKEAE